MMINETIVTTLDEDGSVHIAPMGITYKDDLFVIAPFMPSRTLDNLQRSKQAVINMIDDARVFAGCITDRHRNWPTKNVSVIKGKYLQSALSYIEVEVTQEQHDDVRPVFYCEKKNQQNCAPFMGINRAKAAVIEASILVSRLHILPAEKIDQELEYLQIAIDKTAGQREIEAWGWLMEHIKEFRERNDSEQDGI